MPKAARPSRLIMPAGDARTRLKQRVWSKPSSKHSKAPKTAQVVSVEEIEDFLEQKPRGRDIEEEAKFLNGLANLLKCFHSSKKSDSIEQKLPNRIADAVTVLCLDYVNRSQGSLRTAAFRIIRLALVSVRQLSILLLNQADLYLIRTLDASENEQERTEALKLITQMLFFYRGSNLKDFLETRESTGFFMNESAFTLFPKATFKSIVAVALDRLPRLLDAVDESRKPDKLSFACLAVLLEFAISDPHLVLDCAGTAWIVRAIVGPGANNPQIALLVSRVLIKWLDTAEIRAKAQLHLVIEQIFAPLIDLAFFHNTNETSTDQQQQQQKPLKVNQILESVATTFLAIIRSWTGIFICGAVDEHGEVLESSPFRLLQYVGLGTRVSPTMVKIRDMVIDICCEFVELPYATKRFNSWDDAVVFYAKMNLPDKYKTSLRDDFVVGEIDSLQSTGLFTPNTVDCLLSFRSVAFFMLIDIGLPQALSRLVQACPNDPMAIKATLLLADLLRSGAAFLPQDRRLMLLSVPSLMQSVSERYQISALAARGIFTHPSPTYLNSDNASVLLNRLDQLNDVAFNRPLVLSQLTNISLFVCGGREVGNFFASVTNSARMRSPSTLDIEERLDSVMATESEFFSKVTAKELDLSRLEVIVTCLEAEDGILLKRHKHNDKLHSFFSKIFQIIFPLNGRFGTDAGSFNPQIIKYLARAVRLLVPIASSEPYYSELIAKFLQQCHDQLMPSVLYKGTFSPKNILNTSTQYYFAIISAIGSVTPNGSVFLEESGILQIFMDLLTSTMSIEYIKLIIGSLDYSQPGSLTRAILETALTAADEPGRKWCTRFLGVLAGLPGLIPDFATFGMKLLVNQLGDKSAKVVRHAVRLLHNWLPNYPDALPLLAHVALEPLGDAGILLKSHIYSSEKLCAAELEEVEALIEVWMERFHEEYVAIVEEDVRGALLNVKKSLKGTYARPSNEKFDKYGVSMPIHLFGELAKHATGRTLLVQATVPSRLLRTVVEVGVRTEVEMARVKAALLSLGHIAGNLPPGLMEVVFLPETIACICRMAEECPTLSVRGTAVWSLHLVARSEDGARELAALGWEGNRHTHVIDEVCEQARLREQHGSTTRRRSRTRSGLRRIFCLDGKKATLAKSVSTMDLSKAAALAEPNSTFVKPKTTTSTGGYPLRRIISDSQISLPVFGFKPLHPPRKVKEKLSVTKSVPPNVNHFTQLAATNVDAPVLGRSNLGPPTPTLPQPSFQPEDSTTSVIPDITIAVPSGKLKSNRSMRASVDLSIPSCSLFPNERGEEAAVFAPSSMRTFFRPDVPFCSPNACTTLTASLGESVDVGETHPDLEYRAMRRERMAWNEITQQPHFSCTYRRVHGITGFNQKSVLRIPNRTNSTVTYSYLSRSELKNVYRYHQVLFDAGDPAVPEEPHQIYNKTVGSFVDWTVVAMPYQSDLLCRKVFDLSESKLLTAETQQMAMPLVKGTAQRCFHCQKRVRLGLKTYHNTSVNANLRRDILYFVSLFEIRGHLLERHVARRYEDEAQQAFADPCLYSDVLELMSELNFNTLSRREIHRVFARAMMDVYDDDCSASHDESTLSEPDSHSDE